MALRGAPRSVPRSSRGQFVLPPFSVLRAQNEGWKRRRSFWTSLGIKSEQGRDDNLLNLSETARAQGGDGTSIFDPVLCELAYRWWCPPGGTVLDPFAGGSVRGLVACMSAMVWAMWGLSSAPSRSRRTSARRTNSRGSSLQRGHSGSKAMRSRCSRASQPPTRASTWSLPAPPTSTSNATRTTQRTSRPWAIQPTSRLRSGRWLSVALPSWQRIASPSGSSAMCATGALASCAACPHRHRCSPRRGPPALQRRDPRDRGRLLTVPRPPHLRALQEAGAEASARSRVREGGPETRG